MSHSRRFLPSGPEALEARRVPSQAGLTPSQVAVDQTLAAGEPVYMRYTTRYADGLTSVDERTTVPDGPGSVTYFHQITPAGFVGTESQVDVQTTVGDTQTNRYTTTEPDGATETQLKTSVIKGHTTTFTSTIDRPDGVVISVKGTTVKSGPRSTTVETEVGSDGVVEHYRSVVVDSDDFDHSETDTSGFGDGVTSVNKSTTVGVRLDAPPA